MRRRWREVSVDSELHNLGLSCLEVLEPGVTNQQQKQRRVETVAAPAVEADTTADDDSDAGSDAEEAEKMTWEDPHLDELDELKKVLPRWMDWNSGALKDIEEEQRADIIECAASLELPATILYNVKRLGWQTPTEVQSRVVPIASVKRFDVTIASETGSGKTGAFAIPVLQQILRRWSSTSMTLEDRRVLECLALAPSRELAVQVASVFSELSKDSGINVVTLIGGFSIEKQSRKLNKKPQVVVATIGRLMAHIVGDEALCRWSHPHVKDLSRLRFLILDEADKLFEPGRIRQLRYICELIYGTGMAKGRCQMIVASATLMMPPAMGGRRSKEKDTFLDQGLMQYLPFKPKQTLMVDLSKQQTVSASSRSRKNPLGDVLKGIKSSSAKPSSTTRLNLPEGLKLYACFPSDNAQREQYLLIELHRLFKEKPANQSLKVLVFCNSIGNVKRVGEIFKLIFSEQLVTAQGKISTKLCDIEELMRRSVSETMQNGGADPADTTTAAMAAVDDDTARPMSRGVKALKALLKSRADDLRSSKVEEEPVGNGGATTKQKTGKRGACSAAGLQRLVQTAVLTLHAKKGQKARAEIYEKFGKDTFSGILFTTDVAARGLDFPGVDWVIHLQQPRTSQTLVHRCGRTARGEGCGEALLMITPEDVMSCEKLLTQIGLELKSVEIWPLHGLVGRKEVSNASKLMQLVCRIEQVRFRAKKLQSQLGWERLMSLEGELPMPERPELTEWIDEEVPPAERHRASLESSIMVSKREMQSMIKELKRMLCSEDLLL